MKRIWDKPLILRELKSLHRAGKDLSYNRMAKTRQSLVSAASYHFGSYRKAITRAGIDYADVTRRPRWTKPAIIRLIKQARRKDEDLHWAAVTQRRDELGKAAFAALQARLFGSWDRALHAAGLDAAEISRYRKWSRAAIVSELRERHRDGDALNSGAMQREDPGMHAAAVRHFGNYDTALRAAGLKPGDIRQRRRWTREGVIRELRAFRRRYHVLSDSVLRRHASALYSTALRFFKTLAAARKAAEKKPATPGRASKK